MAKSIQNAKNFHVIEQPNWLFLMGTTSQKAESKSVSLQTVAKKLQSNLRTQIILEKFPTTPYNKIKNICLFLYQLNRLKYIKQPHIYKIQTFDKFSIIFQNLQLDKLKIGNILIRQSQFNYKNQQLEPYFNNHSIIIIQVIVSIKIMSDNANRDLPQANDKQFETFIEMIKNNDIQHVKQFLSRFNNNVLARLELSFRQPAIYFAVTQIGDNAASEMLKALIQHGANPKYKDQNDQTVMFYACRDGKYSVCKLLIQNGLSLNQLDMYGQTPLFYAASQNRLNLVELFQNRELINHADKIASQTALYYASRKGHTQMCKQLINKGANPSHLDAQNKTAADHAKKGRFNETAQFLNNQIRRQKQVFAPQSADLSAGRQQSYQIQKKKKKENTPVSTVPRATYKIVFMNQKGEAKDLTEEQVRNLVKNNQLLESYLANPSLIPTEELQKLDKTQTWQKTATKLLQAVMKHKGSYWFAQPVDPVKFNIMDYFDIIQKPMDLGTVKKKLSHNCYRNVAHFVQDMNLIWGNCYKYNGQTHDISKTAKQLQNNFLQEYKKSGLEQFN